MNPQKPPADPADSSASQAPSAPISPVPSINLPHPKEGEPLAGKIGDVRFSVRVVKPRVPPKGKRFSSDKKPKGKSAAPVVETVSQLSPSSSSTLGALLVLVLMALLALVVWQIYSTVRISGDIETQSTVIIDGVNKKLNSQSATIISGVSNSLSAKFTALEISIKNSVDEIKCELANYRQETNERLDAEAESRKGMMTFLDEEMDRRFKGLSDELNKVKTQPADSKPTDQKPVEPEPAEPKVETPEVLEVYHPSEPKNYPVVMSDKEKCWEHWLKPGQLSPRIYRWQLDKDEVEVDVRYVPDWESVVYARLDVGYFRQYQHVPLEFLIDGNGKVVLPKNARHARFYIKDGATGSLHLLIQKPLVRK